LLLVVGLLGPREAEAGQSADRATTAAFGQAPIASPSWTVSLRNTTRLESWRFFEPRDGGGNPNYEFAGTRVTLGVRRSSARFDVNVAAQYVGITGLPSAAVGPGALGTGPIYFSQSGGRANPQRLYLRYANVTFRNPANGLSVQVGRQAYTSGAEAVTTDAKVEAVRRQRLNARLIGEFEWSLYQRGFDGVRVDWQRPRVHISGSVMSPTQGGFAREAGGMMRDVVVGGVTVTSRPKTPSERRQAQVFAFHYNDGRPVRARPDNSGLSASAVDVQITSVGAHWLSARTAGAGEFDTLVWLAGQAGTWYGQRHRAWSMAAEAGYQWSAAPGSPWLRIGLSRASGDTDGADNRHGTFFPLLPTMRRFSQTTVYSTLNLDDAFVQLQLRPSPSLGLKFDVHHLRLASSADRWYAGSGATLRTGANFGYVTRPSSGARTLGTSFEGAVDWAARPGVTLSGFAGHLRAGPVVTGLFSGRRLWFLYAEASIHLQRVVRRP
jgi:hypothetical protein